MKLPVTPSFRLDGRRALVTGAGRGIGLALAAALAEAGAHVTLVARTAAEDVAEADYDAVLDLNVKSAFFVAQGCVRGMIAAGKRGSLIHIGSQMGHVGGPGRSLYCASKWALEGMNKAFALDLAPHGIRSNTIAPTFIETPLTKPYFEDAAFKASVLSKIKLACLFLASDASALVTGTSIVVDGGWTAD
jgi:NAD(P)-dependent dehydrogenase (short-subunit alcohol dehydrogenase family)